MEINQCVGWVRRWRGGFYTGKRDGDPLLPPDLGASRRFLRGRVERFLGASERYFASRGQRCFCLLQLRLCVQPCCLLFLLQSAQLRLERLAFADDVGAFSCDKYLRWPRPAVIVRCHAEAVSSGAHYG